MRISKKMNSLVPGKFEWNFRHVIFKQILVIDGWGISCKIALIWMSLDFTDDQSTLVQVMAWCHQAASHYLDQCWPRSISPYGVASPQWVNRVTTTLHCILHGQYVPWIMMWFMPCVCCGSKTMNFVQTLQGFFAGTGTIRYNWLSASEVTL